MSLIEKGVFSIDDQGRIWRHQIRGSKYSNYKSLDKPRRAELYNGDYLEMRVSQNGILYRTKAHRIVWIYFYGDINNDLTINHINMIKDDNRSSNLELVTIGDNIRHASQNIPEWGAKSGEAHHNSKLTEQDILEIRKMYSQGNISSEKIAEQFPVTGTQIRKILLGKRWKYLTGGASIKIKSGAAKLFEEQVLEIRERHIQGETDLKKLAKEYHVVVDTIRRIINRKSWKHL